MLFSYFTSQMDLERNLFNLCFGVNVVVTKYFYTTCFKIGAIMKVSVVYVIGNLLGKSLGNWDVGNYCLKIIALMVFVKMFKRKFWLH